MVLMTVTFRPRFDTSFTFVIEFPHTVLIKMDSTSCPKALTFDTVSQFAHLVWFSIKWWSLTGTAKGIYFQTHVRKTINFRLALKFRLSSLILKKNEITRLDVTFLRSILKPRGSLKSNHKIMEC